MILLFVLYLFPNLLMAQFDYTTTGYPEEYSKWMNDATAVFNEIFTKRNYNRFMAPLYGRMPVDYNSSNVARLNVDMALRYLKVFGLDAESQILSFFCEFEMSWTDPRLSWNPEHFNDTRFIFVTADLIWTPDNQIGNTKSLDTLHPDSMKTIILSSNGTVHLPMVYFIEVACVVEISRFPFDNQTCPIPVATMALDLNGQYSSMTGGIQNVNVFNSLGNGEWDVIGVAMIPYQFLTDTVHTLLLPTIFLKRVPNYYVYVIALPGFILTMLGIFGMFWTPHIRKEQLTKLSIGLTTLVAMTVLLDMLSTAIPKTSVFPLLGIYVVLCLGITSTACVAVVLQGRAIDPKKLTTEEIMKEQKEDEARTRTQRILHCLMKRLLRRHVVAQIIFQTVNLTCFIVFLSFWN